MQLKMNKDGKFRIVQFTDTHIGNMPFTKEDQSTFALIDKVAKNIEADLAIHTGDIIWSEGVKNPDLVFQKTLEKLDSLPYPLAITFGNHDSEDNITRSQLRYIYEEHISKKPEKKHCFSIEDRENYVLEIYDQSKQKIQHAIFILDSGDYPKKLTKNIGTYAWLYPEQVEWYRQVSRLYREGDQVKRHLIFQHIPIPEYWQAGENIISGKWNETNEAISAPHINTGMFHAMIENEETWGMFVGHDHENNFDSLYHGIHLVYGCVSGYNTYGEIDRGIRIVELDEETGDIQTYTVFDNDL